MQVSIVLLTLQLNPTLALKPVPTFIFLPQRH
jgi:hypothetical protein